MLKKINYQEALNPSQFQAVESIEGPHVVVAGAGSGKTRVLVYRVAYLVEKGVRPDEILLLTFTRKAAHEMLRRATLLLDERCSGVAGGTFHSFANMVLRKYAAALGLKSNFSILDQSDAEDTLNLIRTEMGFNKSQKRFPRKQALLEVISKSVNKSQKIAEVLYDEYPHFIEWEEEIKKIQKEYVSYKLARSLLDYDDLLVYLKELLRTQEAIRLTLAKKYRYIMIDEYQDTNMLQAHIACLLAGEHKNIMVVGDDAQSIYSFRGANFRNIMDFPKIFQEASIITLEENYRSTQPILNLANGIIANARDKFEKNLFTKKSSGAKPSFVEVVDDHGQSRYVADKILELREEGVELGDIAVLFRSGWHSNDLEVELASRDIPFVKYGGQKFVEAAHIKDVISYLRIIYNMSDAVSWYRALLLMRGIGPKTAQLVIESVIAKKQGFKIEERLLHKSEDLEKLISLLKEINPAHSPAELTEAFLKYYQPLLQDKYDDFHKRLNDLDSLLRIAGRYKSLEQFLTDMALEPPERNIIEAGRKDHDDSTLTLSTIHSAKGLEWHTVFIIYVAEGHIPSYLSLENDDDIEEERRLLYVACTRAKENLFLLKPHLDRSPRGPMDEGGMVFTRPSRFLAEGDILGRYTEMVQEDGLDDAAALEVEDITGRGSTGDRKFFESLDEFFREEE